MFKLKSKDYKIYSKFLSNLAIKLNGYYYVENEVAKELGYNNDDIQVGLSAQEVQKVLPEVVTQAPIDEKYLTIWYDKLIPLLIEAIKELDDKK